METVTLKKKLSTYVSDGGYLKNVPEELLFEILCAWEEWTGSSKEFYSTIGFSQRKMASLIGKAKKLKRDGYFGNDYFKEIKPPTDEERAVAVTANCKLIEVQSNNGQIIRFPEVSQLMEYLEKVG
jgi:hypothetical protein